MHYHILLTERCNSECKYCYEKSLKDAELENELGKKFKFDFSSPESLNIDLDKLKRFLLRDKNPVLIFYGGEPLLEIEKIKEIIEKLNNVKFRMQTNGKLLDKLPFEYLNRIDKILVSLDGDKNRTDLNRGKGTFEKVIGNINLIRKQGYKGEIIARMTLSSFPDIFEQVRYLIEKENFTSVHWQLDAGFYKFDFDKDKFSKFVKEYNKSIDKLIDYWIKDMKKNKRVLMLYPFVDIVEDLLLEKKTKLRCGAGQEGYAIATDGKIVACPIMNCIKDFEAGSLEDSPENLKRFEIWGDCLKCSYKDLCGGRCLYWNKANLWPSEGNELICNTIKHLIDELKNKIPEIKELIDSGFISLRDFSHEKYFGPEIVP